MKVSLNIPRLIALWVLIIFFENCSAQKNVQTDANTFVKANDNGTDSHAIQELIDNAKPGSTLFFHAGVYLIDEPVNILINGLTLKGEDSTIFRFTNKEDYYKKYGEKTGMLNIGADNVTIDHIVFDQNYRGSGRKPGDTPLIGCVLMGCSYRGKPIPTNNIVITNCTIYDYYGDGISVFRSKINNFTVTYNHLVSAFIAGNWDECKSGGEQGINVASGNNLNISYNKVEGSIDDAIATHFNNTNVTITNNTITSIRGRILVNGTTNGVVRYNTINYIRDGWCCIQVTMSPKDINFITNNHHVVVENNTIHINKGVKAITGIMLYGPGVDVVIRNNIIESEDPQSSAGIQLADRLFRPTKTLYFGDSIFIYKNQINNFKIGIKSNITDKVKQPTVVKIYNNSIVGAEKERVTEKTAFLLKFSDD